MLRCASPARWLERALSDVDTLLLDHAHCEKKAAGTMIGFVFRLPDAALSPVFSRMAREELTHLEMAIRELRRRGRGFERLTPSAYGARLSDGARGLVDAFVVAALIEARSCERIGLLAEHAPTAHLRKFYAALHPAEERHHQLLLDAATQFGDPTERVAYYADREGELITVGEDLVRMHA